MTAELLGYILWGVFGLLILATLLGGLIGFMKGLFKTSLKTILKVVIVIVFLFVTPSISNALGNLPIIPTSEGKVTLQFYIADYITKTGLVSPINGLSIYETAIMIANAVIAYLVFFCVMILTQLLISLLTTIVYHGIFRWFAPVETRKEYRLRKKDKKKAAITAALTDENGEITKEERAKKKLPLLPVAGMSLGAVQEFIFVVTLLSPITALSKIGIRNQDGISAVCETAGMANEDKQRINAYLSTIDQSLISKITGFGNYDSFIMDHAGSVQISGQSVSLGGLADSLFDVATPLLKDGTITYDQAAGQVTINYAALLSVNSINSLVGSILGNPQLMALIPPLVDVALNAVSNSGINVDAIDLNNIDWSNDISAINEIYGAVYSDAVKPLISEDGHTITPQNFRIATSTMSDEDIERISAALGKLGQMESIQRNLPTVLSNLGSLLENKGLSILPTDASTYKDIDWTKELSLYVTSLFRVLRTIGMDLSSTFNTTQLMNQFNESLGDDRKREELELEIVGDSTQEGLLDAELMQKISLPEVVQSSLSSIVSIREYVKNVDFKNAFDGLDQEGIKKEFHTLFGIAASVFSQGSKLDITYFNEIDLADEETCTQLADLLDKASASVLFTKLYPSVMKSLLFNSSIDFKNFLYGLTPYSFNYDATEFVKDFRDVLKLLPNVKRLSDSLSDKSKSSAEKLKELDLVTIRDLLCIIVNSDFLNCDLETGTTSEAQKCINIQTVLTNLFSNQMFKDINLKAPTLESLQDISWGDGLAEHGGEIYNIIAFIDSIRMNADFISSTSASLNDIKDVQAVSDMIKYGMDSKLLEPSILEIIDSSLDQYFVKLGLPFNIQEMRDSQWKEDADKIADILALLQGENLDDINFESLCENNTLNALLTTISQTNLVNTVHSSDPVGYLSYMFLNNQDLYRKIGIGELPSSDFIAKDPNNPGEYEPTWYGQTVLVRKEFGGSENPYSRDITITEKGTIQSLCSLVSKAFKSGVTDGTLTKGFISSLDTELDDPLVRSMIGNLMDGVVADIHFSAGSTDYSAFLHAMDFRNMQMFTGAEMKADLLLMERLQLLNDEKYKTTEDSVLSTIFKDIYSLREKDYVDQDVGTNLEAVFDDLMDRFSTSTLMNTLKPGYGLTPIAVLMKTAIQEAGLEDKAVVNEAAKDYQLNARLASVPDWEEEMGHFKSIISLLQGHDPASLGFSSTDLNYDLAKNLMSEMNESYSFHLVPLHFIKDSFESAGLESLCVDPETNEVHSKINYLTHLSLSPKDVAYWNNEIEQVCQLAFGENGLHDVFSLGQDMSHVDLKSVNLNFLYYLGSSELLKENRSYLFYNIMDKNITLDLKKVFKPATALYADQNQDVMRIEELFFRNPKLLDAQGKLDETKAFADLAHVNSVIHELAKHIDTFSTMDASDFRTVEFDFETLNDDCYDVREGQFIRSDFASELVSSMETILMTNENLSQYFGDPTLLPDLYANDHAMVNSVEGRALNGILLLAKKTPQAKVTTTGYAVYYSKADLEEVFTLFGKDDLTGMEVSDAYRYFLTTQSYPHGNSILIQNLHPNGDASSILVFKTPILENQGGVETMKSLTDLIPLTALIDHSFYSLVSALSIE